MASLADVIERYIKQQLRHSQDQAIEINRAQVAETFRCVPSQINYVLTTRFTLDRGYVIESRRGGGGYIRIVRFKEQGKEDVVARTFQEIGDEVTERQSEEVLAAFVDMGVVNQKQAQLVRGILQQETADCAEGKDCLRASLLRAVLFVLMHK